MHTYIVKLHICSGLPRGNPQYTYMTSPPWGNVHKIHEEYIHAHTGATSCYNRKLTLLGTSSLKELIVSSSEGVFP